MLHKNSDKTLLEKEAAIKKLELLKFGDNVEIHNLSDIIEAYFNDQNPTFNTNNHLVCYGRADDYVRNRSYIDLYSICLYYFPQIPFSELYEFLRNTKYYLRYAPNSQYLHNTWFKCNDIDRQVLIGDIIIKTKENELLEELNKKYNRE